MHSSLAQSDPDRALATSAHQLQRAAGTVQTHAANPHSVPTLGITLAHVEEALDRLAVAAEQMANAVADWCGEPSVIADENALPPEAHALRWHLQSVANQLRASGIACAISRDWTRRLLANPPLTTTKPAAHTDDSARFARPSGGHIGGTDSAPVKLNRSSN